MAVLLRPEALLVGLTLLIKLGVLATGALAYVLFTTGSIQNPVDILEPWHRWDAPHYLDLAVFGYRDGDSSHLIGPHGYRSVFPEDLALYVVFYPLYPWLITAINTVVDQPLASSFAVSTLSSLFVAPLLYRLVRHEEGPDVAMRAAWFLLIFPTAYFLHIGYTEALFMALVLGSFLAARADRWWLAGLLGGLAAFTRVNGMVLLLALAAEAATRWFEQPREERRLRVSWLAIGLVPLGFVAYLVLNQVVYGDAFEFLAVQQRHWHKSLASPIDGIAFAIDYLLNGPFDEALMYGAMELTFVAIGLAGTIYTAFRFRPSWFAWMTGNWLLFVSTAFLSSVPRYSLTLFPLFVAAALAASDRRWLLGLSAVSLAAMTYFTVRFATGAWAF